ncbi:transporter substrate-binding domain-containing protein [Pseudoalteromonas fuliginea]|uniref:Transporter substrate-binding domain-containing protein n=1 Tax=Pseudoalteromonas fuliginea TaxID=1872678 RepID=A0AB73BIG0_9GAMM|nr:transporter substrate-binding domain-containing protein [Pseudoalteromonas fuliginea]KAA1161660.1 transporter substrate-binding domain-containing protein [Pseudoalteromonas fuliginea]
MLPFKYLVSVVSLFVCSAIASEVNIINVPQDQHSHFTRDDYLNELLSKALIRADYSAEINLVPVHPHQQRNLMALDGNSLDLYWSMSSPERESLAIAIKIPLFKGYIGKRALLTNTKNVDKFKGITSVEQLSMLIAVQGHDWPDMRILVNNGLSVRPLSNLNSMFALTSQGRIDYFPRSFIEVNSELMDLKDKNLVIVPDLYISYPTGLYYFVSKNKPELAQAIEKGLKIMQKNGEFDALFYEYFATELNSLPYTKGKTIELKLDNPYF